MGEPSINPGPRAQIAANMEAVHAPVDARVTVSIPGGEDLALKTMNGRLGIKGGLSILGTTGIVLPYSCAAVDSFHPSRRRCGARVGPDPCRGRHGAHLGRRGAPITQLDEQALIDMGDFVGPLLKYLRIHPVPRLTIAGGFGKLAKLAAGELDLHSGNSSVDTAFLARLLAGLNAPSDIVSRAAHCETAAQVLEIAQGVPLPNAVAQSARETVVATLAAMWRWMWSYSIAADS